ncbi:WD40 repeat-like protein [Rozella allomycis CSF55]|uniref:DNA damage-binding protein CMR1 n=1 Tax=Rozella allomycis (strain CSF55) TaxID=988480 RepID=A0A4V1J046_ROZAC|nr:WD40 repeat-like protein [Rozella allomycis CSF55]
MGLSEYEKKRQENLKRNQEVLAALKIPVLESIKPEAPAKKRVKSEVQVVAPLRYSRRQRNQKADFSHIDFNNKSSNDKESLDLLESLKNIKKELTGEKNEGKIEASEVDFKEISSKLPKEYSIIPRTTHYSSISAWTEKIGINPYNYAKVTPSRVMSMAFHPNPESPIIFCGDRYGNVGIFNVNEYFNENDGKETKDLNRQSGVTLFKPHKDTISLVRMMELYKNTTSTVKKWRKFSITWMDFSFESHDLVGFATKDGRVGFTDLRAKPDNTSFYQLHERKVGCISFNPTDTNIFATSSLDASVALWDFRNLKTDVELNENILSIQSRRSVTSAFFCPFNGNLLLTTSYDDSIKLYTSILNNRDFNIEPKAIIEHNNQTGRWITPFRATWAPSSYEDKEPWFYVGNMNKNLDIFSGEDGSLISSVNSDVMSAQPAVNILHPTNSWMASGTGSGKVALWKDLD